MRWRSRARHTLYSVLGWGCRENGPVPATPRNSTPRAHTAGVDRTRADLRDLRPDLLERYDAAVPAARAAVLSRLLGALHREPLPGITGRHRGTGGDTERVTFTGGREVRFPTVAAEPFAAAAPGLAANLSPERAGHLIDDPAALARALWPDSTLPAELDNSAANLALARAARPDPAVEPSDGPDGPDAAGRLEQLVTDGHPLHPCCRTRGGMTVADVLAYAPEHHPVIRLRRLRVPADRWHGDAPPILYAHPWQAGRLRGAYPWLADAGETAPVRPLMSLRTLAPMDGGDHVKTTVDVQMTSAVRTVSPAAVHNGPRLSALLAKLTADLPLTVLGEYGAGAVLVDGVPRRELAHLRRQAPRPGPGETVVPLAAFAVPALLARAAGPDPYGWFTALAGILWGPLVTVLDRGVALEAHGQNTLVLLRGRRPARILYRDLGGVRVSGRRLRAAGVEPPPLRGDLPSDDPAVLRTKLAAAALGTVAAELITLLARHHGAEPGRLWDTVAAAVRAAGTADAAALLRDPLPLKATTAMRLAADPLTDRWTSIDNPMAP
jgi:siderophore synthetase component